MRSVTALVAVGVEVRGEWPVLLVMLIALGIHYVPDWKHAAEVWLKRHIAADLIVIEIATLAVLLIIYLTQRLVKAGAIRHRVRRQWRVAWAHVRRAPLWGQAGDAPPTAGGLAARAALLPPPPLGSPHPPPLRPAV